MRRRGEAIVFLPREAARHLGATAKWFFPSGVTPALESVVTYQSQSRVFKTSF